MSPRGMGVSRNSKSVIQSLDRGLAILQILARDQLQLNDVASRLNIDRSSAYRLLTTLEKRGLVRHDSESRTYRLGLGCLELAGAILRDLDIREVARPYIHELASEYGETTFLAMWDGGQVVYVDRVPSRWPLAVSSEVGMRSPLNAAASGKAVLAFLPEHVMRETLETAELRKYTPRTIVDKNHLLQHLEQVRQQGYAIDDEEYCIGLRCVAAPVFDYTGQVRGSLSVSGPANRVTLERVGEIAERVRTVAAQLSRKLGFGGRRQEAS